MSIQKRFLAFSGFSGAIAVALGAMGAHFLKSKLEPGVFTEANLQAFETAVKYQIYHSIVILIIALLADRFKDQLFEKAGYCFMVGIVLFSGSIYLLSLSGLLGIGYTRWLGPITPIGGLFFIVGWLLLGCVGLKRKEQNL
jgi:uncharacterized membrane protein YgdD (TMEM256/DUF423 family)